MSIKTDTTDRNNRLNSQLFVTIVKKRQVIIHEIRKIERKEIRVGGLTSNKKGYRIAEGLQRCLLYTSPSPRDRG